MFNITETEIDNGPEEKKCKKSSGLISQKRWLCVLAK